MIELKITPISKPRMTRADTWRKRPCILKYWAFKDELVELAEKADLKLGNDYKVEFFISMPEGWSKSKKAEMLGKPHQQKPDLDNLVKALNDCLIPRDQTVYHIDASKIWWDEGKIIIW